MLNFLLRPTNIFLSEEAKRQDNYIKIVFVLIQIEYINVDV